VGAGDQRGRNLQAERLGGFKVDNQLKFCWLLYRKLGGIGASENLGNIDGCATIQIRVVWPVCNQPPGLDELSRRIDCRQPMIRRELSNELSLVLRQSVN